MTTLNTIRRRNLVMAGRQAVADGNVDRLIKCFDEMGKIDVDDDGMGDPEWSDALALRRPDDPTREAEL